MATFNEGMAKLGKEHPELKDKLAELAEHKKQIGTERLIEIREFISLGFTRSEICLMIEYEMITVDHVAWNELQ